MSKTPVSGSGDGSEPPNQPETAVIVAVTHPVSGRQAIRGHANAAKYAGCNEMAIRRAEKRLQPDRFGKVWFYDLEALDALKAELAAEQAAETVDRATLCALEDLFLTHSEAPESLSLEDIAEKVKVPPGLVRKQHAQYSDLCFRFYEKWGREKPKLSTRKQLLELRAAAEREEERLSVAAYEQSKANLAKLDAESEAYFAKQKARREAEDARREREREKSRAARELRMAQLQRRPEPGPSFLDNVVSVLKPYGTK